MNTHAHAFELGQNAAAAGSSVAMNPFSPDSEVVKYEQWVDGWCFETEEQANYDSLFNS